MGKSKKDIYGHTDKEAETLRKEKLIKKLENFIPNAATLDLLMLFSFTTTSTNSPLTLPLIKFLHGSHLANKQSKIASNNGKKHNNKGV